MWFLWDSRIIPFSTMEYFLRNLQERLLFSVFMACNMAMEQGLENQGVPKMKCAHKHKHESNNSGKPVYIRQQALRVGQEVERIAFEQDLIKQAGMDIGYISAEEFDKL